MMYASWEKEMIRKMKRGFYKKKTWFYVTFIDFWPHFLLAQYVWIHIYNEITEFSSQHVSGVKQGLINMMYTFVLVSQLYDFEKCSTVLPLCRGKVLLITQKKFFYDRNSKKYAE
jgi:hypothetical protein